MLITRPPGVAFCPNSCRISPSTNSDASAPQAGQTNLTGLVRISGVISKACLAPHEHCTFMALGSVPHFYRSVLAKAKVRLTPTPAMIELLMLFMAWDLTTPHLVLIP